MRTQNHLRGLGIVVMAMAMLGWNCRAKADIAFHNDEAGFSATAPDGWTHFAHDVLQQRTAFLLGGSGNAQRLHWVTGYQQPATEWFHYPYEMFGYINYPNGTQPTDDQI